MRYRSLAAALLFFALPVLFTPGASFATGDSPKLPQAGFRSVGLWKPEISLRMDIAVWYPSPRASRDITIEGWSFRASKDGAGSSGRYPVILLSHDTASSRLASHDLAAHLARHGFIVIAPTHPRDNIDDVSGFFHAANFAERPKHLLYALEAVAKTPTVGQMLDGSRVGVLGVGAGAATALQLAGAAPDLTRLASYCLPPSDTLIPLDPLCSNWARGFHPRMQREFLALTARAPDIFTPGMDKLAQPLSGDATLDELAGELARRNPAAAAASGTAPETPQDMPAPELVGPSPREQALAEATAEAEAEALKEKQPVLAVGLLTPGFIDLFSDAALRGMASPVGMFMAANDAVYPAESIAGRLQTLLPDRPASRVLQSASHYDLQAPCPPMYQDTFAALCGDRSSNANDMRKIRNDFFVRFFQKALGPPAPPPLLPLAPPAK